MLIDRLWPRGLRKADAAIDHWLKEIAPSTELHELAIDQNRTVTETHLLNAEVCTAR